MVPVTVYEGNVEVLDKAQIHPLHKYLLQFICVEHNLEKVVESFGLDKRITEEAIVDLIYKDLIYIDFENAVVYPSSEIATIVDQGRLETYLELSYPDVVKIHWIQDNVTGQVCMESDVESYFRRPVNLYAENQNPKDRVCLNPREFINIKHMTPETLIKIGRMKLREYINEGLIFNQVKRVSNLHVIDNKTLYIPLKSEEINGISYNFPRSEKIPTDVVESWSQSITQLDPYTLSDLTKLDEDFLLNYDWEFIMRKWDRFLSLMGAILKEDSISKKSREKLEDILLFLESEGIPHLLPKMQEIGANVKEVQVFSLAGTAILDKIQDSISGAQKMIVIGSAFVNLETLREILSLIVQLPNKNLKIILIWGGLGNEVPNINRELSKFADNQVVFVKGKEFFHSKFLLVDSQIGWITSCNLLSYFFDEKSANECICEFRGGLILNDILEYIRQLIPEKSPAIQSIDDCFVKNDIEQAIITDYSKFSLFQDGVNQLIEQLQTFMNNSGSSGELLLNIRETFADVKKYLTSNRNKETAILIENLDHRKLLRSALAEARKQIKIGTDRILQRAIGPVLISSFNEAIGHNIHIDISWGREDPNEARGGQYEMAVMGRDFLDTETKYSLNLSKDPCHSHAKYLILDDHLSLITSYNLLAFSGNGLAEDEITKELGVVITSKKIASKMNEEFPLQTNAEDTA